MSRRGTKRVVLFLSCSNRDTKESILFFTFGLCILGTKPGMPHNSQKVV